jgi:hypothetical protein
LSAALRLRCQLSALRRVVGFSSVARIAKTTGNVASWIF